MTREANTVPRLSIVLAIEISNPSAWTPASSAFPGVAVGRVSGGTITFIASESIDPAKSHDDGLLPAIDRLFAQQSLSARDISRIAVSIGPGGFTATRIAVTAAKLIAEAIGAECVGVPSSAVAVAAAEIQNAQTLVLLSAKGETFHTSRYSPARQLISEPEITSSLDVNLANVSLILADRFAPDSLRARAATMGIPVREPAFDPRILLSIQHAFPATSPLDLAPIYPREPEAVTKWRELKRLGRK